MRVERNMDSLVSIILPLYNAEDFIVETIESVCKQTYSSWELLVIDDCSTDSSIDLVEVMAKKDSRIKLLHSPKNFGGPAGPRNIGLEYAQGEYIAFLDADDVWDLQKLEKQIKTIENDASINLICCKLNFIDRDGGEIIVRNRCMYLKKKMTNPRWLFFYNYIAMSSVLIRRASIGSHKFDEDSQYVAIEDWKMWMALARDWKNKGVYYQPEALVSYRIVEDSISARSSNKVNKRRLSFYRNLYRSGQLGFIQSAFCQLYVYVKMFGVYIRSLRSL